LLVSILRFNGDLARSPLLTDASRYARHGSVVWPGERVAKKKRKSIRWALKRKRLLRSVKLKITPRAVRLSNAFEKARKKRAA